ncbi:MAG: tetratricopeptide repeat protein [candidate division KSB1 bacterium]|nr:tetratricopeptide repeat protein [candidate division KSB1 bacterium]
MKRTVLPGMVAGITAVGVVGAWLCSIALWSGCAATGPKISPEQEMARRKAIQDSIRAAQRLEILKKWSLGYEHYKNKSYRDAIPHFWKVIEMDTAQHEMKEVYTVLGDAYIKLNVPDSALLVYELGVEVFPQNAHLHRSLGYLYGVIGRVPEAIHQYEEALKIEPNRVDDRRALANLYIKAENIDGAILQLEKVLEVDPGDKQSQETLSSLYRASGDEMGYVQALEKAHQLDPENTETMLKLGKAYYDRNENQKAVTILERLLAKTPNDTYAMELQAGALQNMKRFKEAIAVYDKVIALKPDNKRAYCEQASCYKELGQFAKARALVRKVSSMDPKYGYAYFVAGEIYEASVDACMTQRGERSPKFDDKLVYWFAYEEYRKAAEDLETRDYAQRRMAYLKNLIPTEDDIFFHKEEWTKKRTRLDCYQWIY